MILLPTDLCLLTVLFVSTLMLLWQLRIAENRVLLARIFEKPFALSAGIILAFFVTIGTLDSIRLNALQDSKATSSISLLDKILSPLDTLYEKTYSAPLALTLYTPEIVMTSGSKPGSLMVKQVHFKLTYPPLWVKNNHMVYALIGENALIALGLSLTIVFLAGLILWGIRLFFYSSGLRKKSKRPLLIGLGTFFICVFLVIFTYKVSRYVHLFGTGKIGQDIFYYTVKSIRTGLIIGLLTTIFMLPLAIILGISSGYFGGLVDDFIQYLYTTLSSIPGILLITASVLSLQTYMTNHPQYFATLETAHDVRLLALCFILGLTSWTSLCRLLRAETLKLREMDFVQAAIALGSSNAFILRKHLLPNVLPIVMITVVLDFSFLVLAEALLAYVGVGVSPMTISWGNMINSARLELAKDPIVWWPVLATFIFMFTLVLSANLFADAVRDALDPNQAK